MDGHDENTNNSGATNSTQQPIFTPNPPATPSPVPQPSPNGGSVVEPATSINNGLSHPYLSNHPTQVFSSETGDIIINSNKEKKRKSKIIIIIAGLVTLAAIAMVVILLLFKTQQSSKNPQELFNIYANYMLYGEEKSTAPIEGIYLYGDTYKLSSISDRKQISDYFTIGEKKYNEFLLAYLQNPTEDFTESQAKDYQAKLSLLKIVSLYPNLRQSDLIEAYITQNGDVEKVINDYYGPYINNSAESVRNYGEEYIQASREYSDSIRTLDDNGCINRDMAEVIESCIINPTNPEVANAITAYVDFGEFYLSKSSEYGKLKISVFEDIWEISQELQ